MTREDAFQRAERSLASSRFKGLGRLVLRLPDRALAVLGLVIAAILVAIIR